MTTLGDTLYEGASNIARLPGNISATKKFLAQTGTGSVSVAPVWATIIQSDVPNAMTTGGDTIYGGASGIPTRLPNGTAGQVLTSNGTTVGPSWQSLASAYSFIGNAYLTGNSFTYTGTTLAIPTGGSTTPTVLFNTGTGTIDTTAVTKPQFLVTGLLAGYYKVTFTFAINPGGTDYIAIYDGTNQSGSVLTGSFSSTTLEGFFHYTGTGNRTFSLYATTTAGTGTVFGTSPGGGTPAAQINFSIEKVA